MKTIEEKRLEFLEDTVKYYSEDVSRRALDSQGSCRYITEDGRRCAIGRFIIEDHMCEVLDNSKSNTVWSIFKFCPHFLPKHILDLGSDFLGSIQLLHDGIFYWHLKGITGEGKEYVEKIKTEFCKQQ